MKKPTRHSKSFKILKFNANSHKLNDDETARKTANTAKSKLIKNAPESLKEAAKSKKATPEYTVFTEVIVDENLKVTTRDWPNYTAYLISSEGRAISDIPVVVNMNLDMSGSKDVVQSTVPQFLNMYLKHDGIPLSAEGLENAKENQKAAKDNSEPKEKMTLEEAYAEQTEKTEIGITKVRDKDGNIKEYKTEKIKGLSSEAAKLIKEAEEKGITSLEKIGFESTGNPNELNTEKEDKEEDLGEILNDEEEIDGGEDTAPFMLKSSVDSENSENIDVEGQLKWFNANVPKDKDGKPLVGLEFVKGLIDGKAYGKFTKNGNILLSDLMEVNGVLYHETWHAVTRKFMPKDERYKMYEEARKLRGKARTFKGEAKKLSDFTDKEVDEWLAEEFRSYVMADGNYTVGQDVKKSWIDRLFDRIFKALTYFTSKTSNAELLMSRIHGGYFANPSTEITVYSSQEEAYMEAEVISPTLINNSVEGMTVHLFQLAAEQGLFEIEDLFDVRKKDKVSNAVNSLYGDSTQSNKVWNKMMGSLNQKLRNNKAKLSAVKSKAQKEFLEEERVKILKTAKSVQDNWGFFIEQHKEFLVRFELKIKESIVDEIEEGKKTGVGFDTAQSEIDPNSTLPHPVRLLLSTLPAVHEDRSGNPQLTYNNSGFPKLADFGSTMAFLYKELSNTDPKFIEEKLIGLAKTRPDLKLLIKRLGIETSDWSDKTAPQVRMINRILQQFDQSNRTFHMQSIDRQGGRFLIDNNSSRVDDLVRSAWKLNFRTSIENGIGKLEDGKMIINKNVNITSGGVTKSLEKWSTTPMNGATSAEVLAAIGIKFSVH